MSHMWDHTYEVLLVICNFFGDVAVPLVEMLMYKTRLRLLAFKSLYWVLAVDARRVLTNCDGMSKFFSRFCGSNASAMTV